ncbi:hypothetical protein [Lysobacter gummosus]
MDSARRKPPARFGIVSASCLPSSGFAPASPLIAMLFIKSPKF